MPVGVPADPVGRPSARFRTLDDLAHALGLPLVGGAHDDAVSDMSFHGGLPGSSGCVLAHSLPRWTDREQAPWAPGRGDFRRRGAQRW